MNEKELFEIFGFIKASEPRIKALKAIENSIKTPCEIGKELDLRTTEASTIVIRFKKEGLAVCLNESAHKGRLYTTTDFGKEIIKKYEEYFDCENDKQP